MSSLSVPKDDMANQSTAATQTGTTAQPSSSSTAPTSTTAQRPSGSRILSTENAKATGKFLKAFGKTAVSMHPLWLMGEAITGQKVGGQLKANSKELVQASEAIRDLLATSTSDVLVIVNDKLREKGEETSKTADVLKRAGDNAIVVVSSSIEKAKGQLEKNSPALKRSMQKNGKQVVIVVDRALKHPLVITGIHKYAKAQGIPHPEAILTVASLGLSKILAKFPTDEELAAMEAEEGVVEIDAGEFERTSTKEAEAEAKNVGRQAHPAAGGKGPGPSSSGGAGADKKKDGGCVVM